MPPVHRLLQPVDLRGQRYLSYFAYPQQRWPAAKLEVLRIAVRRKISTPRCSNTGDVTWSQHDLWGGIEVVFTRFASSVRRAIRKAERSGLNVCLVSSREAVLKFYWLHTLTRKRQGRPPLPLSYFSTTASSNPGPVLRWWYKRKHVRWLRQPFSCMGNGAVYKFAASDLTFQTYVPTTLQCRRVLNP